MADTHDTMKKAVELTVLILLALIFLAISLSAILGNACYLIAATALLIIFIIIFRIKQKRSLNLFMEIDYSGQSVEEFDVNTEHLNMEILKQAVLDQSGCKSTYVYGDYMTDNGEIMYFRDYFLYPETTD